MKALVGAFNQEEALVGAFSVIVKTDCETDGPFYSTNHCKEGGDHLDGCVGVGGGPQVVGEVDLGHGEQHQRLEGHPPPRDQDHGGGAQHVDWVSPGWVGVGQVQEVGAVEVLPDVQRLHEHAHLLVLRRYNISQMGPGSAVHQTLEL